MESKTINFQDKLNKKKIMNWLSDGRSHEEIADSILKAVEFTYDHAEKIFKDRLEEAFLKTQQDAIKYHKEYLDSLSIWDAFKFWKK